MKIFSFVLAAILLTPLASFAQSQREMNMEAARDAAQADKELNAVYKKLLTTLDEEAAKLLKASQRAWIAYRDADAASSADQARGGSMAPMLYSGAITQLTEERTKILRERIGGLEGNVASPDPEPAKPAPAPETKPKPPRAEPVPEKPASGGGGPAGAKSQAQAAQQFFDAYKAHNREAAQAVAAEDALKKLLWKSTGGGNPTLKLMDNTHIYYEGGSIELKMQKNSAGRWFIADVGLFAD